MKTTTPPDENYRLYTLVRVYYVHDPHRDFKKTYYYLFGKHSVIGVLISGLLYRNIISCMWLYVLAETSMIVLCCFTDHGCVRHNLCLVRYYFDGEPHPINPRPHGNYKTGVKHVRTMKSAAEKMSSSSSSSLKDTVVEVIFGARGMLNSRCAGALPKSQQQVSYYKRGQKETGHNFDVLYNVMLQFKISQPGKEFVRAVAAAPEPMAVLATNQQLDDMVKFLTDPADFSIMGVDPTFNFGDFNVTPIVYRNLLLEHRTKGHSPVMVGPMLLHHQRSFFLTVFLLLPW